MMAAPALDDLIRLRTALDAIQARRTDLEIRIRQRQVVEIVRLRARALDRSRRFKDLVMLAPVRSVALAGRLGREPVVVAAALDQFARAVLAEIATAGRDPLEADIAGQPPPAAGANPP